ncbi:hypothetical protein K461DRAFT_281424 [Myriangium duriaei CBS 260.36]|uniref:Uncharacterized protein n=1 Tax=Myriangium duriaei CBS 260.36 TaxID=1168546 RepID=A0A9P4MHM8_9PEZI|nr:hypothetical protein K461DRAFT_281424 [Myriangium duriaei CBS 260.36]
MSSSRAVGVALTAVAVSVALGSGYLVHLKRSVSKQTTCTTVTHFPRLEKANKSDTPKISESYLPQSPLTLPAEVASSHVLSHEQVFSKPIDLSSVHLPEDETLTAYLRGTMVAFSSTPQAYMIRSMVSAEEKQTFDKSYIDSLNFVNGDIVNGVYRVCYRGPRASAKECVELMLDPSPAYRGPAVKGMICAVMDVVNNGPGNGGGKIVFVNETLMWRRPEEKATMLEGGLGRWLHGLLAQWLVVKGMNEVASM